EVVDDAADVVVGMETQDVSRLLEADLVVSHVANMFNVQLDAGAELLFDLRLNLVGSLSHGVVSGRDVKDSGEPFIRLDCPYIGGTGVVNTDDGAPNGGIMHSNLAIAHRAPEHGVDDQIEPHSRTITRGGSLSQRDDREFFVDQVHHRLLTLQL